MSCTACAKSQGVDSGAVQENRRSRVAGPWGPMQDAIVYDNGTEHCGLEDSMQDDTEYSYGTEHYGDNRRVKRRSSAKHCLSCTATCQEPRTRPWRSNAGELPFNGGKALRTPCRVPLSMVTALSIRAITAVWRRQSSAKQCLVTHCNMPRAKDLTLAQCRRVAVQWWQDLEDSRQEALD